jgi:hypothetical protein
MLDLIPEGDIYPVSVLNKRGNEMEQKKSHNIYKSKSMFSVKAILIILKLENFIYLSGGLFSLSLLTACLLQLL